MPSWRRRIRGAMGMGVTWAAAWFGAGMVLLVIVGPDAADVPFPLFFGLLGFFAGATFSAVLALTEQRRSFEQLSLPRVAGWGALGGLLLASGFVVLAGLYDAAVLLGAVFALAGATCATGTLAVARRAAPSALPATPVPAVQSGEHES